MAAETMPQHCTAYSMNIINSLEEPLGFGGKTRTCPLHRFYLYLRRWTGADLSDDYAEMAPTL